MSTTFTNAKIFVGTDATSFASAMTIDHGKVSWIGDQADVTNPAAIDLQGQTVLPGLIDCHTHPKYIADALHGVACTPPHVNSIAELIAALKTSPAYGQGADVWIEGWGFDETKLAEHRAPTVDDLDQVSTTQPIFLYRSDCHSSVGNSKALALAGIDATTPDPVGGKIERFADGRPTGFMREVAATQLLIRAKSAQSYQTDVANLTRSSQHYLQNGIVAIGEMMGRLHPYDSLQLYRDAKAAGFQPRASLYYVYDELNGEDLAAGADDQLRIAGIKVFMDGSISGETADNQAPYPSGKRGVLLTDREKLAQAVAYAKDHHLQIAIHAMGDAAIQLVIDTTKDLTPWLSGTPSVRIEHASLLSDAMLAQIDQAQMTYGLATQPIFFFAEDESYRTYLNTQQVRLAYRLKAMLQTKALTALSSDAPCTPWYEPDSPFYSIYAAVTRRAANGQVVNADQAISVPEAVLGYTKWAAQLGQFTHNGSLSVGKAADFVILSDDIFTVPHEAIKDICVQATWLAGQEVYRAD